MEWENNQWDKEELVNVEKDTNNSGIEELNYKAFNSNAEKTFQIIQDAGDIILPKRGVQVRFVTFKSMNMALLIDYISKKEKIEEMLITAYSINHLSANLINEIIKKHKCETEILISNLRNQAYRKKEELTKDIFIKNPNVKLFFCSSHAKIISIKTKDNYYHIEGSGNLSFNSRVEQMVVDNDEKLFNFTKSWMKKVREFLKDKKELVSFGYD